MEVNLKNKDWLPKIIKINRKEMLSNQHYIQECPQYYSVAAEYNCFLPFRGQFQISDKKNTRKIMLPQP